METTITYAGVWENNIWPDIWKENGIISAICSRTVKDQYAAATKNISPITQTSNVRVVTVRVEHAWRIIADCRDMLAAIE